MGENLTRIGRNEKWLEEKIKLQGYKKEGEIFLAIYRAEEDKLSIYSMS